jgi:phage-related baseplate assembly protein
MAGSFTSVDLAQLAAPGIVETIDFETILAAMLADLRARDSAFDALVESDPAYKILEVAAFREVIIRQRVNDAARAVMLAYATGSDLDHLGALVDVARLELAPGDADAGIPATMESDDDFRRRIQLAPEGFSVAGPTGAYVFHALGADPDVEDVAAISPSPGVVEIYVLSRGATGVPSPTTLANVDATLSAETVRPLTDFVSVYAVDVVSYTVEAEIDVADGPDQEVVRATSQAAAEAYVTAQRKIGLPIARSGLFAAIHGAGVRNVNLIQPAADVDVTAQQVAICSGVSVSIAP